MWIKRVESSSSTLFNTNQFVTIYKAQDGAEYQIKVTYSDGEVGTLYRSELYSDRNKVYDRLCDELGVRKIIG